MRQFPARITRIVCARFLSIDSDRNISYVYIELEVIHCQSQTIHRILVIHCKSQCFIHLCSVLPMCPSESHEIHCIFHGTPIVY